MSSDLNQIVFNKMKTKNCYLRRNVFLVLVLILSISLKCSATDESPQISIVTDNSPGVLVLHGLSKLTDALQAKNISFEKTGSVFDSKGQLIIVTGLSSGTGEAAKMLKTGNHQVPEVSEALTIWKTTRENKTIWVISGYDDRGLMYGLLDVAIRIAWSTDKRSPMSEVREITEKPDVPERAISFYTMNRAYWESRFYNEDYWARYLDLLAQNRFNSMVVIFGYENGGFLAPCYPYFFDVEGFSDVRMVDITPMQQQRNLEALNKLINMAHDRGIRFTVGIWDHIYRGGVQGGGIPGSKNSPDKPVPGLVWGVTGENLISYTKSALTKFVRLVPDLDAIQFRMHSESGLKKDEQLTFWTDIFKMMKVTSPNLRLDLRAKELPESVVQSALDVGIKFRITTKYWMEQMGLPFTRRRLILKKVRAVIVMLTCYAIRNNIKCTGDYGMGVRQGYSYGVTLNMYAGSLKPLTCMMVMVMKLMNLLRPRWKPSHMMLNHLIY